MEDLLKTNIGQFSTIRGENYPAFLFIKHGSQAGFSFPVFGQLTTIGRDQSSHILLQDMNVSKRHASIRHAENEFIIEDQQSTNGTYVNGKLIDTPTILKTGDIILIGNIFLEFKTSHLVNKPAAASHAVAVPAEANIQQTIQFGLWTKK